MIKNKYTTIRRFFFGALVSVFLFIGGYGVFFSVHAYPKVFKTDAVLEKDIQIKPTETVTVLFSESVIPASVENALKISPMAQLRYEWSNGNRRLDIAPKNHWLVQENYLLEITDAKSLMLTKINAQLSFTTITYPSVTSFYPARGEKNVAIDIEEPIIVNFSDSLTDFSVKFIVDPMIALAYEQDQKGKWISLMPKDELEKGKKYSMKVFIKYKKEPESRYRNIYETFFETAFPLPPAAWDKDPVTKLAQAKTHTGAKITDGKYIDINLGQQVMVIFDNGVAVDAYLVSSGKKGMETPMGDFMIHNKAPKPWSKKYSLFMPNWMAIVPSGEFGIHELPEWPGGYKEGANHLGTPVSHGCVRLGVGAAKRVYDWAELGTPVKIYK